MTEYYSPVYLHHTAEVFLFGKTQGSGALAMGSGFMPTQLPGPAPGRRREEQQLKSDEGTSGFALAPRYSKLLL